FMQGYFPLVLGHLLDLAPLNDSSALLQLMRFAGKFPVGLLGAGGAAEFAWDDAFADPLNTGGYLRVCSAPDGLSSLTNAYPDWGTVYRANFGGSSVPSNSMKPFGSSTISVSSVYLSACSWLLHGISKCVD